jgi:hypothetical protein
LTANSTARMRSALAQALGCDGIVIGRDAGESFVNRMFGNLVEQVQHIVGGTANCQVLGP